MTTLGRSVLIATAVLGAAGWWLGWVEVTMVAATLAGALAMAGLLTLGRSTYAVGLTLAESRVTVGERAVGTVTVRNTARRRLLPARVEVPVGTGVASFPLPSLGARESHEDVFAVPTVRRAVVRVGPVRSLRGDPLGLLRRHVSWGEPVDLYVHPPLVSLGGAESGAVRDLEGRATRGLSDSDMSFHALRDYVAGDDRRHIHWRSSARLGALMVRQFEDTRRTHVAVALSTAEADYADAAEFELAVAVAASIGVHELREARELTFLAERRLRTDAPVHLLDDVAGVVALPDGRGAGRLARWVRVAAPNASVAVLVVGSGPTAADLRARARHLPVGVRTLVLVCREGSEVEVTDRNGLAVARIGALTDLPRLLRRVVAG